jgi:hypothetical protein
VPFSNLQADFRKECDTANEGTLNRDAFIKGMWRIDEELRRAQMKSTTSASSNSGSSFGSFKIRQPSAVKAKPMSKPILR